MKKPLPRTSPDNPDLFRSASRTVRACLKGVKRVAPVSLRVRLGERDAFGLEQRLRLAQMDFGLIHQHP